MTKTNLFSSKAIFIFVIIDVKETLILTANHNQPVDILIT